MSQIFIVLCLSCWILVLIVVEILMLYGIVLALILKDQ